MAHGSDTSSPTKPDPIEAARGGSAEALEELVHLHEARVFRFLARLVPPGEVEDLAQEAFLRAFRDLGRFRGEAAFSSWLLRIARNLAMDRHRRAGRRGAHVGLIDETGEPGDAAPADPGLGPAEALESRRLEARLEAALARLSEQDRTAVLLHDQDRLSADEVAGVIGGSAGAVRVRLFRARRKLREWLKEEM